MFSRPLIGLYQNPRDEFRFTIPNGDAENPVKELSVAVDGLYNQLYTSSC